MNADSFAHRVMKSTLLLRLLTLALLLSSCTEKKFPAAVTGYNHMSHFAIAMYSVNGAPGKNLNEAGGGGGQSCCISLPEHWHPGIEAKIVWRYDKAPDDTSPLPPPQEKTVLIPEYKWAGRLQVHFYEHHKVTVVVSNCSLGHPFYPLPLTDQLPWSPDFSKDEALEIQKKGGMTNNC
jgi:hypothetical protein